MSKITRRTMLAGLVTAAVPANAAALGRTSASRHLDEHGNPRVAIAHVSVELWRGMGTDDAARVARLLELAPVGTIVDAVSHVARFEHDQVAVRVSHPKFPGCTPGTALPRVTLWVFTINGAPQRCREWMPDGHYSMPSECWAKLVASGAISANEARAMR